MIIVKLMYRCTVSKQVRLLVTLLFLLAGCAKNTTLSLDTEEPSLAAYRNRISRLRRQAEKEALAQARMYFPAFINAIANGDMGKVNAILKQDPTYATYVTQADGTTPLMRAAWNGHLALAKQFFALYPTCLNQKDNWGKTALYFAVENGHLDMVKYLLEQPSIEIDGSENKVGTTPLMIAVEFKHTNIVQLLLDKGASLGLLDKRGNTVLMRAAVHGKVEVVVLLLQKMKALNQLSRLIDKQNLEGYTALVFAVTMGGADKITCLLDYGANPNIAVNGTNMILAHLISSNTLKENIPNFQLVMGYSKQLIIQIEHQQTSLLEYVLGHKNIEALYFLMDTYADHKDFWFNADQLVKHIGFLLVRYYTITDQKEKERLALIVTKLLYKGGAIVCPAGQSFLPMISLDELFVYLVKNYRLNWLFCPEFLGKDIDKIRPIGRTLLSYAAELDKRDLIKQLLNYNVNVDSPDPTGRTALAYAAAQGHWIVFNQLVEQGASIDAQDREGKTILSYALEGWIASDKTLVNKTIDYLCILQKLIDNKVDVTVLPLEAYLQLLDFILNKRAQQAPQLLDNVK
ncbi:MAG: ankyrin repeat domain-containing protein, partial [Amoebophilaceae bacterium]|nr:ankyrin repeat domain-containing protein [Amoebophilaceae bacterium]